MINILQLPTFLLYFFLCIFKVFVSEVYLDVSNPQTDDFQA